MSPSTVVKVMVAVDPDWVIDTMFGLGSWLVVWRDTAQVAKSSGKGYEEGMSIGSFVGYAPIADPHFVVLVKLDNPKNVEWAESSAAPTFGQIMKFLLEYAKIKPTEAVVAKK